LGDCSIHLDKLLEIEQPHSKVVQLRVSCHCVSFLDEQCTVK